METMAQGMKTKELFFLFLNVDFYLFLQMLHNGFHVRKAPAYHNIQSLESKVLLKQIMDDPKNFDEYIKR
jgi:hypothetical protein